jgi:hypothetical protein
LTTDMKLLSSSFLKSRIRRNQVRKSGEQTAFKKQVSGWPRPNCSSGDHYGIWASESACN